ncbi:MAG: hypothetical protein R6W80_12100 [Haliea sp.]
MEGIEVGARYSTLPHCYDNRGASGESLIVSARYLTPAPAGLSAVASAAIWMQYLTDYYPMEDYVEACRYLKEPRRSHGKVVIETGIR